MTCIPLIIFGKIARNLAKSGCAISGMVMSDEVVNMHLKSKYFANFREILGFRLHSYAILWLNDVLTTMDGSYKAIYCSRRLPELIIFSCIIQLLPFVFIVLFNLECPCYSWKQSLLLEFPHWKSQISWKRLMEPRKCWHDKIWERTSH